jgi:GTP-binding protein EngB required for normal cell division
LLTLAISLDGAFVCLILLVLGAKKKKQLQEKRARKQGEKAARYMEEEAEAEAAAAAAAGDGASSATSGVGGGGNVAAATTADGAMGKGVRSSSSNTASTADGTGGGGGGGGGARPRNWLDSQFAKATDEEFAREQLESTLPIDVSKRSRPWQFAADVVADGSEGIIDIPKRPFPIVASKEQLEKEEREFAAWKSNIENSYAPHRLNVFELNLNVWRQLWRCIERSHMIMLVTDSRFPLFHFPPALYQYVKSFGKPVVLVLNKCDLVPSRVLDLWEQWFVERYPDLRVLRFSSFRASLDALDGTQRRRIAKGKKTYDGGVDREKWIALVRELAPKCPAPVYEFEDGAEHRTRPIDGIYVGIVGHPNVGKSAFINGVVRRKVVSVSSTAGHTKHFQTIALVDDDDNDIDDNDDDDDDDGAAAEQQRQRSSSSAHDRYAKNRKKKNRKRKRLFRVIYRIAMRTTAMTKRRRQNEKRKRRQRRPRRRRVVVANRQQQQQ